MYDRKLQEKAGKGSAKEESLNLNIINAGAVKSGQIKKVTKIPFYIVSFD